MLSLTPQMICTLWARYTPELPILAYFLCLSARIATGPLFQSARGLFAHRKMASLGLTGANSRPGRFPACCLLLSFTVLLLVFILPAPASAQTVTATLSAGTSPYAAGANPVSNKIYVANSASSSVTVIDGASNSTTTVAVGSGPNAVAVNPVANKIYVANSASNSVTVIDGASNSVTTVTVGSSPVAVAVNPVTNKIYVANSASNSVTVIDGASNSVTTVTVGSSPVAVAVNPVTNKIYVANSASNSVTVIDGASNSVTTVTVGSSPVAVAVNPVTNKIYVANSASNSVTVIDGASNSTATVTVGSGQKSLVVNPVTNKIYVANSASNTVTVIDGASNSTATVTVGSSPHAIAVNSVINKVYVANYASNSVTAIDGASNSTVTVTAVSGPNAVAVNPATNKIYVANNSSNNVTVIDGTSNSTVTVTAVSSPKSVAANSVTNQIYVANSASSSVTVIDGASNATTTVTVGSSPNAVAVNPATNKIYVANNSSNNVTVIDGASNATTTVSTGSGPYAVAVNPVTNQIYVANNSSNNVTVIDGASNATATVAVGSHPVALAVNPATNKIYVANNSSNTVTVIDGATNTTVTVAVGSSPNAVAVNPATNKIYVANNGSNNVTVIDGASNTTATVTAGSHPLALAVNPITNMIYVVNNSSNSVTVIDGASNATAIVSTGSYPCALAVDPAINKIYVPNSLSGTVTVIDGASNATTTVGVGGTSPYVLSVNPVNSKVYVANSSSSKNVTVISPSNSQSIPLNSALSGVTDAGTVSGLAIFSTTDPSPSFTASVTNSYSPVSPAPTALYYQIDTTQGPWNSAAEATGTGANPAVYSFSLNGIAVGTHTLYAYAAYGNEGTPAGSGAGSGNSPEIGNLTAYPFLLLPMPTNTTLTADVNPQDIGQSVTFTAYVTLASGIGTPSGEVTFYDGTTELGQAALDTTGHAALAITTLSAGAHSMQAVYSGDGSFASSSASVTENILGAATVTVISGGGQSTTIGSGFTNPLLVSALDVNGIAIPNLTVTLTAPGSGASLASSTLTATTNSSGLASFALMANHIAGSYSVTAAAGSANAAAALTNTPAIVTPVVTVSNKVYTGTTAASISARSLTGVLAGDSVTLSGGTAAFGDANVGSNKQVSITGLSLSGAAAGNYQLASTSVTTTANITAAPLIITAISLSKSYGQVVTFAGTEFTASGLMGGDSVSSVALTSSGAAATAAVNGSPYAIVASAAIGTGLGNYSISYGNSSLTVNPAPASVMPAAASKIYGAADPPLTGSLSGFLSQDNVTATYTRTAGETVAGSPYTISGTLSPAGALGNYTITYNTASFTITKAAASVTPAAASKIYGTSDPYLIGTLTGFATTDLDSQGKFTAPVETGVATVSCTVSGTGVYQPPITLSNAAISISGGIATGNWGGSSFYGIYTVGAQGSGYSVNDTGFVTQGSHHDMTYQVLAVGAGGYVKQIAITNTGTGYTQQAYLPTTATSGSGSGLTITYWPNNRSTCIIAGTGTDLDGTYPLLTAGVSGQAPYTFVTSSTSSYTYMYKDDAYPSAFVSPLGDGKRWLVYSSGFSDTQLRYVKIRYTADGVNWVYPPTQCSDNSQDAGGNVRPGYNVAGCLLQPDSPTACHAADHVTPNWCDWDAEDAGLMPDGSILIPIAEYDYGVLTATGTGTLNLFYVKCTQRSGTIDTCGPKQYFPTGGNGPAHWCTAQTGPPFAWFNGGVAITAQGGTDAGNCSGGSSQQYILVTYDNGATWPTVIPIPPMPPYTTAPTAEYSWWTWGASNACGIARASDSYTYPNGPLLMWCSENAASDNPTWTISATNLGSTPNYLPGCTLTAYSVLSPYCTPSGAGTQVLCAYYERQTWSGTGCPSVSGILHSVTFNPDYVLNYPTGFNPQIAWGGTAYGRGGGYPAVVSMDNGQWLFVWQGIDKLVQTTGGNLFSLTATYSRMPGETVAGSPYTISATLSPAEALSNYTITYNTANFIITPASVTPILSNLTQPYDGNPKPVTVQSPVAYGVTYTGISPTNYPASPAPPTDSGSYAVLAAIADPNYVGSASGTLTIGRASSSMTLISSTNPSVFGQAVSLTATVISPSGTSAPGTVAFMDGATSLGSVAVSGNSASATINSLSAGTHSLTAVYSGNTNISGSASGAIAQLVTKATTTTAVASSASSIIVNGKITFTATVTGQFGGIPTGTVTFKAGTTTLGAAALSNGSAAFSTAFTTTATRSITAVYSGDSNYTASTSAALSQGVVSKYSTATVVKTSGSPSYVEQLVTFTATVSSSQGAPPDGESVTFRDGTAVLGTGTTSGGVASFSASSLSVAIHSITTVYAGDSTFATSTSNPISQAVSKYPATTVVISSGTPSYFGQSVTFTATVSSSQGAPPDGESVTFRDGTAALGTSTTSGGAASFSISSLSVATHGITAVYAGDSTFTTSTSKAILQVVNKCATTTVVVSSGTPSYVGQSVTFTATVSSSQGAPPDGEMVTFRDGATVLGTGTTSGGAASFSISSLSVAAHGITAVYAGDSTLAASTSKAISQVVTKDATSTVVSSSINPSAYGQAVTFTAVATPMGSYAIAGTVTFKSGGTVLGTGSTTNGSASYTTSALTAGAASITAVYNGDSNNAVSTSAALSQAVSKAATVTALSSSLNPSPFRQEVTFTATVSSSTGITPAGTVTFKNGTTSLGTVTLNTAGTATLTSSSLPRGNDNISAMYNGTSNFVPGTTSLIQTVN